jgi:hypothetical protein
VVEAANATFPTCDPLSPTEALVEAFAARAEEKGTASRVEVRQLVMVRTQALVRESSRALGLDSDEA